MEISEKTFSGLFGMVVVGIALLVICWAANAVIVKVNDATSAVAVLSAVTGIVGTIIGAYFGVNVGSSGKQEAVAARNESEQLSRTMALLVNPEDINKNEAQALINQSLGRETPTKDVDSK